jgi:hypothetical protein
MSAMGRDARVNILRLITLGRSPGTQDGVTERFTENVDILPTLCEAMGVPVPAPCDGMPLTPFVTRGAPLWRRESAPWQFDWRGALIASGAPRRPWDRGLERRSLAVRPIETEANVQFADDAFRGFAQAADPGWRAEVVDPAQLLTQAPAMLAWRAQHADRASPNSWSRRAGWEAGLTGCGS